jgi:hypothetical protein
MLVLCVAGVIGVGWAVRDPSPWLLEVVGRERVYRVHFAYARFMGAIWRRDGDGIGIPDSVRWYLQLGRMMVPMEAEFLDESSDRGFTAREFFTNAFHERHWKFVVEPGERRHMHERIGIGGSRASFARGMRVLLTPQATMRATLPRTMLSLPGGTPTGEPLLVPVAPDGTLDFDIVIPADAVNTHEQGSLGIRVDHAVAKRLSGLYYFGSFAFGIGWRRPPIPFVAEEIPPDSSLRAVPPTDKLVKGPLSALHWERLADPRGICLIEATRDPSGQVWYPVTIVPSGHSHADIIYWLTGFSAGATGPMRFRVTPIKLDFSEAEWERDRRAYEPQPIPGLEGFKTMQ